jgi:hypothetical protein
MVVRKDIWLFRVSPSLNECTLERKLERLELSPTMKAAYARERSGARLEQDGPTPADRGMENTPAVSLLVVRGD